MAVKQLQFYGNDDGSTASLVYDDVALTASGVQVHVVGHPCHVNLVYKGVATTKTYPVGTDTLQNFGAPSIPITISGNSIAVPGLTAFGVAVDGS